MRLVIPALLLLLLPGVALSEVQPTNDKIRSAIIQASRNAYYATGHPCACPYDHARNGSMCGGRSAYSRPGGASPKCYPQDVSEAEVAAFRGRQR